MKNKIISIFLALMALTGSVLTSCGENTEAANTNTVNTDTVSTVEEAAETTTEPEYKNPEVNYDGREFIFSAWKTDKPNWVATSYFEAEATEQNGDLINDAIYRRNMEVEELLGVEITAKPFKSSTDMVKPTLAGDHYADTVLAGGDGVGEIVNKTLSIDLKTIPTLELDKSWWDAYAISQLSINNKLFFAPGNISTFCELAVFCTYFNKNMVNDFKLDDPYTLVRDGKWTIDKLREMAQVVASDLNGDGVMDENDRFGLSTEALTTVLLMSQGVKLTTKDSNDIPSLTVNTERAANVINKVVPLYRDKKIALYAGDFSSKYSHVFSQLLTPMFISGNLLFENNWLSIALEMRNMEHDFGILPPAKYDESQDKYYVPSSESWTYYAVVPITEPDLDYAGNVMNALGYFGRIYVHEALIEKTITDKALRDKDTEEMLRLIFDNRCYDLASIFGWGSLTNTLNAFIGGNKTDFASTIAKTEAKIQSEIEKTVEITR